jgi:hypothetical protein
MVLLVERNIINSCPSSLGVNETCRKQKFSPRSDSAKIADVLQAIQRLLSDQHTLESPRSTNLDSVQDRPRASSRTQRKSRWPFFIYLFIYYNPVYRAKTTLGFALVDGSGLVRRYSRMHGPFRLWFVFLFSHAQYFLSISPATRFVSVACGSWTAGPGFCGSSAPFLAPIRPLLVLVPARVIASHVSPVSLRWRPATLTRSFL